MSSTNLKTVESIFAEAIGLQEDQLDVFLAEQCGDNTQLRQSVIELLGHDRKLERSAFLEQAPIAIPQNETDHESVIGEKFGVFTLSQHIGSGGMGDVYLSVRDDDFKQQAAIKIIRTGAGSKKTVQRFRKEMQFLAALGKHPNITNILDAGTSEDGQMYIAMEYVEGLKINEYCDTHRMGIRDRLRLFSKACEAVQFAHQNAILHRDLKPSNLLVTAGGKPMLIDFGVAKLAASEPDSLVSQMQTLQYAFTPGYASPEQIGQQTATTASDVYSLGVILYELLAGKPPHDLDGKNLAETVKLVCETDPAKPSTASITPELQDRCGLSATRLQKMLRGDLDRIVMKAIDLDIDRRYQTVQQLTEDIQRFVDGKPVHAQPDSVIYRANKYVRRNALAVATATAFVLMLLVAVGITSHLAIVAKRAAAAQQEQASIAKRSADSEIQQRLIAEKQERNAKKVIELFDRLMSSADPRKTGDPEYPARQLLDEFSKDLRASVVEDPLVKARLQQSLASALTGLGDYKSARAEAELAASLLDEHLGPEHISTLAAKLRVSEVALSAQSPQIAARWLREVIEIDGPSTGDDSQWNLIQFKALARLAEAETQIANLDVAQRTLTNAENKMLLLDESEVAEAKQNLDRIRMRLLIAQGKLDQALPSAKHEYTSALQRFGESDYHTAEAGDLLASIYLKQQDYEAAIELYESSFRISKQLFGDRQNTLLRAMYLAEANYLAGDFAAADSWFQIYEPLHTSLRRYQGSHHHKMLLKWSECLCEIEQFDAAEELLHRCCYRYFSKGNKKSSSKTCTDIREQLLGIFIRTDRNELANHWLLPPNVPSPIEPTNRRVDATGKIELVSSDFDHMAQDMKHHATRWQVRAADQTFQYSPTLNVTSTKQLAQITIPPSILLPNQRYFWRVAHIGQNRVPSEFSEELSFHTDSLAYEMKPVDLTRHFNRDVVHSPGDESEDPFKPLTTQLVIDGYQLADSPDEEFHGVPVDRRVGPHQLGDYRNRNSIQLDRQSDRVLIELPPARLKSLRFLLGSS